MERSTLALTAALVLTLPLVSFARDKVGGRSWFGKPSPASPAGASKVVRTEPSASGHGVTMRPRLGHSQLWIDGKDPLYVANEIEVTGGDRPDRRPLALALVLDVSGSMQGEQKLQHVVKATQYVLDRLTERDRAVVVAYDSDEYEVYVPEGRVDPSAAKRALAKLRPGSGTHMERGLRLGLKHLAGLGVEGSVRRLLLLSDGRANEGVSDTDGLVRIAQGAREMEASVSTFGVGANYNEDLMAAIAEGAGGNYHVIDRGAELAEVFRKEFDELGSVVGSMATLEVKAPAGLKLAHVYGYPMKTEDGVATITMRDLFHGMKTKVMMKFERVEGAAAEGDGLVFTLRWNDSATGDARQLTSTAVPGWVKTRAEMVASADPDVGELAQEVESARVLDIASREYEKGNIADAKRLLSEQKAVNEAAIQSLGGTRERLSAQNRMFDEAMDSFEAPAHSRGGKAAVKSLKQSARMANY